MSSLTTIDISCMRKEEQLARTLHTYGVITALSYPEQGSADILAKFKDGTLWLIRVNDFSDTTGQLSVATVLRSLNLHEKAKDHNAIPIICSLKGDTAEFYQINGRKPFNTLSLLT